MRKALLLSCLFNVFFYTMSNSPALAYTTARSRAGQPFPTAARTAAPNAVKQPTPKKFVKPAQNVPQQQATPALRGQTMGPQAATAPTATGVTPAQNSALQNPAVVQALEAKHYAYTIGFLKANDYQGLRNAMDKGLNINAKNQYGNTPVCSAIRGDQYQWFNMLKAAGADLNAECIKEIDLAQRENFLNNYVRKGGFVSKTTEHAVLATKPVNWMLVGGIAGGVVLAGGITAIALSGGGGGGSSHHDDDDPHGGDDPSDIPNGRPVDYPKYPTTSDPTAPEYYMTAEFGGSNFSDVQNFLGQVNAQYAYASAAAKGTGVAGEGVIVAELDSGVDYSHPELAGRIATGSDSKKLGFNGSYGPCRGTDRKNCWYVDDDYEKASFYGDDETVEFSEDLSFAGLLAWFEYEDLFPDDYDWDLVKNVPVYYGGDHGTHVAGIMAASKNTKGMHGVAYNAKLIGATMDFGWYTPEGLITDAFTYLTDNGARLINNSWGPKSEDDAVIMSKSVSSNIQKFNNPDTGYKDRLEDALNYTSAHSVAVLFAAGNSADNPSGNQVNPSIISAAPMAMPNLLYYRDAEGNLQAFSEYPSDESKIASSLFITVVSVNADNSLASYSQKCGPAAKWCIAAPGGDVDYLIASTVPGTGYGGKGGTSMATPVVSGSLAVIMAAFPSLSTQEAVALLFETASDIGSADLYGHGLVNLKAAMEPVGTLSISTGSTLSGVALDGGSVVAPKSFHFKRYPDHLMVLDKYKRPFNMNLSKMVRSTSHSKQAFANDLKAFVRSNRKTVMPLSDNLSFSFNEDAVQNNSLSDKYFALTWHNEAKTEVKFSFASEGLLQEKTFIQKDLVNPFTSSISDVYTLSHQMKLSEHFKMTSSGMIGKNNFFDGNEHKEKKNDDSAKALQAGLIYTPFKRVAVNVTAGMLDEKSSSLGFSGRGAFETKGSNTYYTGIEVNTEPFDRYHLNFGYYRGYTKGAKQNAFMTLSDLSSESWGVNSYFDVMERSQIGFNVSSPLKVKKGTLALDIPVARDDYQDIVYRQKARMDISSDATEVDLGVYFVNHEMENVSWQAMCGVRLHPEHNAQNAPDYRVMLGLSLNY